MPGTPRTPVIGTLNEKPLHAALKEWYARADDRFEVLVDGYVIDIVRGELLIEIQTGNFSSIKRKLVKLVANHPVRLVYPIAQEKWLIKLKKNGQDRAERRKSPKRGTIEELFRELLRFPELMLEPNFSIDVLFIQEEELRRHDEKRRWRRRGWVTVERRLLTVVDQRGFKTAEDFEALLPDGLPGEFTTSDLAAASGKPRSLAQKMTYCLCKMNVITRIGKQGRYYLYARTDTK